MKDINIRNIPKETSFKDVVIIGNGPSGIALSYMLAGNWPYWNTEKVEKHPDELLRARLNYANNNKSLVEQDLITLSDGLEGRSTNPVSLLLDSLEHPSADLGMELPSMLEYKLNPDKKIDHIVLGKGPPGGAWHRMDPNLRTLSLAAWMSLPGLSYGDWECQQLLNKEKIQKDIENSDNLFKIAMENTQKDKFCRKCAEIRSKSKTFNSINNSDDNFYLTNNNESESGALCCKCTKALNINLMNMNSSNSNNSIENTPQMPPRRNLSLKRLISKEVQTRALVSRVAQYYQDYVSLMDLNNYFLNDTVVTLIAPLNMTNEPDEAISNFNAKYKNARWIVTGINRTSGRPFYFACRNVVLANGVSDLANRLGLRGEDLKSSWVKHELPELEAELEKMSDRERRALKPVVVVGAGLSAADAVTICRSSDIPVIHVFRSRTAGLDKMLPENVYPEYHEVQRMMKDPHTQYDYYTPLPEHTISDLFTTGNTSQHNVTVRHLTTGETKTFEISYCAILIGSRPDLRFISNITKSLPTYPSKLGISNLATNFVNHTEQVVFSPLSRKLTWLKNICSKCKHLNICDWSRRNSEYRKVCGHQFSKICECNNKLENQLILSKNTQYLIEDSGLGLGIDPSKPIDSKTNQISVDKFTNEIEHVPNGLYAMGPLVGDNFVRFIPGGALAITAALNKEND